MKRKGKKEEKIESEKSHSFHPGTRSAEFHSTCHMYLQWVPGKKCHSKAHEDRCEVQFPAELTQPFIPPSQKNCIPCSFLCGVFRKRPWKTSGFLLSLHITEILELFINLCPKPKSSLQAEACQRLKDYSPKRLASCWHHRTSIDRKEWKKKL